MLVYILLFTVPLIWYLHGRNGGNSSMLAIFMFGFALFVGMSDMLGGYDRYIYGEIFDSFADATSCGDSYAMTKAFALVSPVEKGWGALNMVISWFTANRYIFILVVTLLTYTCLFVSLRRYAANYPLAMIVFMGLWFFFTFTYLRQVLAATIAWLSIPYIIKRQFWKFLPFALVTISMHKSGVIFFPMYFLLCRRYEKRTLMIAVLAMLVVGLTPIPNALFMAYGDQTDIQQADYSSSGSSRIAYIVEAVLFLYFLFKSYDSFDRDRKTVVLVNLAFMFCLTLLFFSRSSNGGRLSWYYMIGIITVFSAVGSSENGLVGKKYGAFFVVLSFVLFFRILSAWGPMISPYKSFLTNGVRDYDELWEKFEYDHMYDVNKLYRAPFRFKVDLNISNISRKTIQGQDYGQKSETEWN